MSGIAGCFNLDGRPVEKLELRQMTDRLAHRGPDHSGVWQEKEIGLGHRYLRTSPLIPDPIQPLESPQENLVLTAESRIDNRDELLSVLNIRLPTDQVSDGHIILHAYSKWGVASASHLLGAFSFTIWDARKKRLYCARDFAGIKPFYYHHSRGSRFVFASEIKAILELSDISRALNEARIGDYLTYIPPDATSTFYSAIQRLPAGHFMVVTRDSLRIESYFSYNSESELKLDSDEAYADAFMELLESAVRCRTRNVTDVGVTLSGGLDSTTIASVAASQSKGQSFSVHTFSAIFDTISTCDERRFIKPVLAGINATSTYVPGDKQHPIGYLDRMLKFQDEPFSAPNAAMMWDVYAAIQQANLPVVLSGHGGDETVSHGLGYLKELANQRTWLRLATELHAARRVLEHSFLKTFLTYIRFGLRPDNTDSSFVDFLRSVWRSGAIFRPHTHSDSSEAEKQRVTDFLSPTFLKRFDYRARMEFWRESRPEMAKSERDRHYRVLTEPIQALCFEVLDKMGYAHSFELRYPLWDQRIVEFCLALPANQKMNGGRGRIVMRRAMEGRLPKDVQWRLDKTDFTENLKHGLLENDAVILPRALHSLDLVGEYVDIEKVGMIPNKMLSGGATSLEMSVLLITTTLNKWLQKESA